ncbi:MAG: hypothetical protein EBR82_24470 [Caulobacteraceae bacterium]|nr:hypothetical protein [Caulobacteraceae bacterium]
MSEHAIGRFYMEIYNEETEGLKTAKVIASYDGTKGRGLCTVFCTVEILPLVRYNWAHGNLDHWINTEAFYWEPIGIIEYNTPNTHDITIKFSYPRVNLSEFPNYHHGAN